jgi:hypothetical protein
VSVAAGRLGACLGIAAAVVVAAVTGAAAAGPVAPRNEIVAKDDALGLLGRLVLPPGATRSEHEPAGDGGALAYPFESTPDTPNAIDDHEWWVLPDSPAVVIGYVQSHPPSGGRLGFSGMRGGHGQPTVSAIAFSWPQIVRTTSTRSLLVEVVPLADGSTGVRADSQVVWITPRPAGERVPPASQPGVSSCPADLGSLIRLAFYLDSPVPLAVATIDPSGCGLVSLTIGGRREPPLAGGVPLARRLGRVLEVRLETGVPGPGSR